MKLSLRLILFLAAAVTIVTFVVSKNEVRAEKRGLRTDLVHRAEILSESLQEIVEPALEKGSREQLRRIVERFGNREQLAGVAVYDNHGEVLAESSNLQNRFVPPPVPLAQVISSNTGLSQFINVGPEPMHVYYMPLHDKTSVIGVLAIFHDVGYIETQSARMWRATFWHVIAGGAADRPNHRADHPLDNRSADFAHRAMDERYTPRPRNAQSAGTQRKFSCSVHK